MSPPSPSIRLPTPFPTLHQAARVVALPIVDKWLQEYCITKKPHTSRVDVTLSATCARSLIIQQCMDSAEQPLAAPTPREQARAIILSTLLEDYPISAWQYSDPSDAMGILSCLVLYGSVVTVKRAIKHHPSTLSYIISPNHAPPYLFQFNARTDSWLFTRRSPSSIPLHTQPAYVDLIQRTFSLQSIRDTQSTLFDSGIIIPNQSCVLRFRDIPRPFSHESISSLQQQPMLCPSTCMEMIIVAGCLSFLPVCLASYHGDYGLACLAYLLSISERYHLAWAHYTQTQSHDYLMPHFSRIAVARGLLKLQLSVSSLVERRTVIEAATGLIPDIIAIVDCFDPSLLNWASGIAALNALRRSFDMCDEILHSVRVLNKTPSYIHPKQITSSQHRCNIM